MCITTLTYKISYLPLGRRNPENTKLYFRYVMLCYYANILLTGLQFTSRLRSRKFWPRVWEIMIITVAIIITITRRRSMNKNNDNDNNYCDDYYYYMI